ncbi:MAG TPA: RidA family protein [bacterium]|nr:RidA family protein [bacterium]
MERKALFPPGRPRPAAPYSPGIRLDRLVFTSGQVGSDAGGKVPADVREQTRNCIDNCRIVLEAAGSSLHHVAKVTVFLTDIGDFPAMNEVYRSAFSGDLPARSTVQVAALARPELHVEIEMIGYVP